MLGGGCFPAARGSSLPPNLARFRALSTCQVCISSSWAGGVQCNSCFPVSPLMQNSSHLPALTGSFRSSAGVAVERRAPLSLSSPLLGRERERSLLPIRQGQGAPKQQCLFDEQYQGSDFAPNGSITWGTPLGTRAHTQQGPILGLRSAARVLKLLIIVEHSAPHFHLALGPLQIP